MFSYSNRSHKMDHKPIILPYIGSKRSSASKVADVPTAIRTLSVGSSSASAPFIATAVPTSKLIPENEGCLSFPGMNFQVKRFDKISVKWFGPLVANADPTWNSREIDGIIARMFQHECEHLDGKLIIDNLSKTLRNDIRRDIRKRRLSGRW